MSKFDELKKLAKAATPGIWTAEPPAEDYERDGGEQYHWSVRAPYPTPPMISYQLCRLSSLNNNEEKDAQFIAAANPAVILELLAIQAQLVAALKQALGTIDDYLEYDHNGDPWTEDARTMGEMDINDYANDGRQAKAIAALAAAGAQP